MLDSLKEDKNDFCLWKDILKILIVNVDSDEIGNISHIFMQRRPDWQFMVANSGKQCLNMVNSDAKLNLVIIGMEMADMSGLDLIGLIRADSDIPIIFISDDKDVIALVKAFDSGANDYVVTPFSGIVFIARLEDLIRRWDWDFKAREGKLREETKKYNKQLNIEASLINTLI